MRYETLYDGQKIPILGLGTWTVGGGMSSEYSQDDKWVHTIKEAIRMGYTHIDTAELYGAGHTEELLGRAIKGFPREDLFITTKVWNTNLRYKDVLKALRGSLKRLGTDFVDLYLIHWPNNSIPLEETFRAFNVLVQNGEVTRVGVSNFNLAQLKRAQELSDIPIAANQVEYNIFARGPERNGVLEYCQKNNILLTAYEPLGKGRLINNPMLHQIGSGYKISAAQVAVNWLIQKPKVITIPMSSTIKHLKENLQAIEITLSEEDLKTLDGLYSK